MLFFTHLHLFSGMFNTWSIFTFTLYRKLNWRKNIDMASNVVVTFLRSRAISSDNFHGRKHTVAGEIFQCVRIKQLLYYIYYLSSRSDWNERKVLAILEQFLPLLYILRLYREMNLLGKGFRGFPRFRKKFKAKREPLYIQEKIYTFLYSFSYSFVFRLHHAWDSMQV